MDAIEALLTRKSVPRLQEPGPTDDQLETLMKVALRAPDHAGLRPWEFIIFSGENREKLGQILVDRQLKLDPASTEVALEKARKKPMRAPMIIAVIAKVTEHPKVPAIEQKLSAGAAAQNILIAAHALGLAGIWRTGSPCFDEYVREKLGAVGEDEIIGFIYLGTPVIVPPIPEADPKDYFSDWQD